MPYKIVVSIMFLLAVCYCNAQHTFSIVAIDSVSGEIGSAGATCGDSIIWPGTPGAKIISDIIPGIGAIHTQSYWLAANQQNARNRMSIGDSPGQIIDWLKDNDVDANPSIRQYGVVGYVNNHTESAAYTGTACMNYKNHILGPNYAIQGNILLGQSILDSIEARFLNTAGSFAEKLMAALQGAKVPGADSRCLAKGVSSLSAFIRIAKPSDPQDLFYLDLNIAGTPYGKEPIDTLQTVFDIWKNTVSSKAVNPNMINFTIYPNPSFEKVIIRIINFEKSCNFYIEIFDICGRSVYSQEIDSQITTLNKEQLTDGPMFIYKIFDNNTLLKTGKLILF